MKRFKILVLPLALVAVFLIRAAFAEVVQTHYNYLRTAPTVLKDAISAVETKVWTATPIAPEPTRGNPNIAVHVKFGTSSATCVLACGLYVKVGAVYTYVGQSEQKTATALADETPTHGGGYSSKLVTFDTFGASHYDLRVITISAGTVTVTPWTYGAESKGIESP